MRQTLLLKANKAFTLLEILIVLAIIGLIVSIGIPQTRRVFRTNLKTSSLTISDYAQIINEKERSNKAKIRVIDARYGNRRSVQTGDTIRDEFDRYGIHFVNSYGDDHASVVAGHNKVREEIGSTTTLLSLVIYTWELVGTQLASLACCQWLYRMPKQHPTLLTGRRKSH